MTSNPEHNPEFDNWVLEPFHINALHIYAYFNHNSLLNKAVACRSPFFPTRTGKTPLQIALDRNFLDCVESIYKALKQRFENGDRWAFYHIGESLVSLNNVGFQNLHKVYELALRKCSESGLPKYCDENISLPLTVSSHSPVVDIEEFGSSVFVDEGKPIAIAQSSFRISMALGSQDSIDLIQSIIDCPNESIYDTTIIKMILVQKWAQVRWFFALQSLVYAVYLLLLVFYSTFYYLDPYFLLWPFLISCVLTFYEVIQMYFDRLEYLKDIWNFIDLFRSFSLFIHVALV